LVQVSEFNDFFEMVEDLHKETFGFMEVPVMLVYYFYLFLNFCKVNKSYCEFEQKGQSEASAT
jgi:hypothetical protein